jgi:hypothetical protein
VGTPQRGAENSETVSARSAKVSGLIQYAQISHGGVSPVLQQAHSDQSATNEYHEQKATLKGYM